MCIVFGLCNAHASSFLPQCQKIDKTLFSRLNIICGNVARCLSSPTARFQISTFGRNSYGLQQLAAVALCFLALDWKLPQAVKRSQGTVAPLTTQVGTATQ